MMNSTLEQLKQACYGRALLPAAREAVDALADFVLSPTAGDSVRPTLVSLAHALDFLGGQEAWKRAFMSELSRRAGAAPEESWPTVIGELERELAAARERYSQGRQMAGNAREASDRLAAAAAHNRELKARCAELRDRFARYAEGDAR